MIRIEGNYIKFDKSDIYINKKTNLPKKISGHSFVKLCDKDEFNPKGDCVLELLKMVDIEPIDIFYTNRGSIAEDLVKRSFKSKNCDYMTFNAKEINYDNFSKISQYFGGLVDGVKDGCTIVEVKSKSMKDYDKIEKYGVEREELQGKLYTVLFGLNDLLMEWVFFPPEVEEKIKNNVQLTVADFKNFKKIEKHFVVDANEVIPLMNKAMEYYWTCINECRIPITDVSEKYMNKLLAKGVQMYE